MLKNIRRVMGLVMAVVTIAALYQEFRKPSEERTWRGKLWGFLPYDLRTPNMARMREAFWNPDDSNVFTARPFGIGWAINFAAVLRIVQPGRAASPESNGTVSDNFDFSVPTERSDTGA